MHLPAIGRGRRTILLLAPLVTVIAVGLFGRLAFGSLADLFDFQLYYLAVENVLHGQFPWAHDVEFSYPPLVFVPLLPAYGVSQILGGFIGFAIALWALMIVCTTITTLCVYHTCRKFCPEKTAFAAALLNATAVSAAYYTLCRFDAFPACLAMIAVTTTLYGDRVTGYLASVLGLFAKVWPILVFPFLWLYNARNTSVAAEAKERAGPFLLGAGLLFGIMIVAGYDRFLGYAGRVYCNTVPYAVHQYLLAAGIAIPFDIVAVLFRILTVVIVMYALYLVYRQPSDMTLMLKMMLVVIVAVIFFSAYRSPQYIVWFTPFAALLVADDLYGILAFVAVQLLAYIEYPLSYGVLYVNENFLSPWGLAFFTVYFIVIGLLVWRALCRTGTAETEEAPRKKKKGARAKV